MMKAERIWLHGFSSPQKVVFHQQEMVKEKEMSNKQFIIENV